jgi:2-dehydropantoate 2-reductase
VSSPSSGWEPSEEWSQHASALPAGTTSCFCVRAPFEGLVVEGPEGILRATPRIVTTPDAVQPVPWVLLATKAHQTAGAADWLRALATSQTTVAILQNGVEHKERVAPYANGATLLPIVVECPAVRVAPGRIV